MAPRGHKCTNCTHQKGQPDVQCRKIQDHDLPDGGDLHRDTRGGFQLKDHRRGVHVPGASAVAHHMSRLCSRVDSWVHNGPPQTIPWDVAGY